MRMDGGARRVSAREPGGVSAIAISHPHFYGSMIEYAHAFGAPVYIHSGDRAWVARPDPAVGFAGHDPGPELG